MVSGSLASLLPEVCRSGVCAGLFDAPESVLMVMMSILFELYFAVFTSLLCV